MSVQNLSEDLVKEVLESFKNSNGDHELLNDTTSKEYQFFSELLNISDTDSDYITFYCVFRDLYDKVFSIGEIYKFLEENNLTLTVANIDKFLNDKYNNVKLLKQKQMYQMLMFGSFDNGILAKWASDSYSKSMSNKIAKNDLIFIRPRDDLGESSYFTYDNNYWLIYPKITYYGDAKSSFRTIREAELEYCIRCNNDVSYLNADYRTTLLNDIHNILKPKLSEWFLIDRRISIFLKKPSQKALYSYSHDMDEDILFVLRRHKDIGITVKEFFDECVQFVIGFTNYILTNHPTFDFFGNNLPEETWIKQYIAIDTGNDNTVRNAVHLIFQRGLLQFFKESSSAISSYTTKIDNIYQDCVTMYNNFTLIRNAVLSDKRFQSFDDKFHVVRN